MFRQPKASSSSSSSTVSSASTRRVVTRNQVETCRYPNRVCSQPVLDQYDYCLKHILEDKNAPYKPCGYTYAINNKRCLQPAPRGDKRDIGYCASHLWKTQMKRMKTTSKNVPQTTPESLLAGFSHYIRPTSRSSSKCDDDMSAPLKTINPFADPEISKAALSRSHMLECASESDSDVEPTNLDGVWKASNEDSSDAESIDSQMDDPLRHAGTITAEEVVVMTRNKLIRLQTLYRRQFDRLASIMKEKRRKYLLAIKKEKETYGSIYEQTRTTAKDVRLYEKLKALKRYQRKTNTDCLAYYAGIEKRTRGIQGSNYKPAGHTSKCTFTEGGVRCSKVTLPLTKFCFKHILDDPNQSIFRACGCDKADTTCTDTVTGLCAGETCLLHIKFPTPVHTNLPDDEMKPLIDSEKLHHGGNDSEQDASATESAFSTDNRDSPERDGPRKHCLATKTQFIASLNGSATTELIEEGKDDIPPNMFMAVIKQEVV